MQKYTPGKVQALIQKGIEALSYDRMQEAKFIFAEVMMLKEKTAEQRNIACYMVAKILYQQGDYEQAAVNYKLIDDFVKLPPHLRLNPDEARKLDAYGTWYPSNAVPTLPGDIWRLIFTHLRRSALGTIVRVCKSWRTLSEADYIWGPILRSELRNLGTPIIIVDKIFHIAKTMSIPLKWLCADIFTKIKTKLRLPKSNKSDYTWDLPRSTCDHDQTLSECDIAPLFRCNSEYRLADLCCLESLICAFIQTDNMLGILLLIANDLARSLILVAFREAVLLKKSIFIDIFSQLDLAEFLVNHSDLSSDLVAIILSRKILSAAEIDSLVIIGARKNHLKTLKVLLPDCCSRSTLEAALMHAVDNQSYDAFTLIQKNTSNFSVDAALIRAANCNFLDFLESTMSLARPECIAKIVAILLEKAKNDPKMGHLQPAHKLSTLCINFLSGRSFEIFIAIPENHNNLCTFYKGILDCSRKKLTPAIFPLNDACEKGNLMIVNHLLQCGFDPNIETLPRSALFAALGFPSCVAALLANGANIDIVVGCGDLYDPKLFKPGDVIGYTLFHAAIREGNQHSLEVLLNHEPKKSTLDTKDKDGNTPLTLATIKYGKAYDQAQQNICIEVSERLLAAGASVNTSNTAGISPLIQALKIKSLALLQVLLKYNLIFQDVDKEFIRNNFQTFSFGTQHALKYDPRSPGKCTLITYRANLLEAINHDRDLQVRYLLNYFSNYYSLPFSFIGKIERYIPLEGFHFFVKYAIDKGAINCAIALLEQWAEDREFIETNKCLPDKPYLIALLKHQKLENYISLIDSNNYNYNP